MTTYRIPISQVGGMITYREVDLRSDGDDPLMCWLRNAADWEITNLRWDEKIDQPGEVTWHGGTLWDDTTDGEVHLDCTRAGSGISIYVRAAFRPRFSGIVTMGGIEWRAFPTDKPTRKPTVGNNAADALTTGTGNTVVWFANPVSQLFAPEPPPAPDPYRTASVPAPVTAKTVLTATCTGVVEQAFKDSVEDMIRRVYNLLSQINRKRNP